MAVNRYRPHILVLPEDDANRQIANGFVKDLTEIRRIQILTEAGGWGSVLEQFASDHAPQMDNLPNRFMVLLIDFDEDQGRLVKVTAEIPPHLRDRVFVLGAWNEPQDLRTALGLSWEAIGAALARACQENIDGDWAHELLRHNAIELDRLRPLMRPILFP